MTYAAKINTKNGNIEISASEMEEGEFATEVQGQQPRPGTSFTSDERNYLQQKFFELAK